MFSSFGLGGGAGGAAPRRACPAVLGGLNAAPPLVVAPIARSGARGRVKAVRCGIYIYVPGIYKRLYILRTPPSACSCARRMPRGARWACHVCSKTFPSHGALGNHKKTHTIMLPGGGLTLRTRFDNSDPYDARMYAASMLRVVDDAGDTGDAYTAPPDVPDAPACAPHYCRGRYGQRLERSAGGATQRR